MVLNKKKYSLQFGRNNLIIIIIQTLTIKLFVGFILFIRQRQFRK